jgi:hypothetical protein
MDRTSKTYAIVVLVAVVLSASGCSFGQVTDKSSGSTLGGAYIKVNQLDVSTAMGSSGTIVKSTAYQTADAWSSSMAGANGANGIWYLNPYGAVNSGDTKTLFLPEGWSRFYVLQSGYDARVFFRPHLYSASCNVYGTKNPYSAGPYPYDTTGPTTAQICAPESFQLSSNTTNYAKDPDMIVDPRTILDNVYRTTRGPVTPAGTTSVGDTHCEGLYNSCIRVSVGTANVGVGDLWVTAPHGQNSQVTQHRWNRNSGMTDTALTASFVQDSHPHLHFKNWTQIRLRKMDSTCNSQNTATKCAIQPTTGAKVSFCLTETVSSFDTSSVAQVFMPNRTYSCGDDGTTISQGIGSGRADVYTKGLAGQMIGTDGLHGDFWLEVEVNPADANGNRSVIESDYTNNVSRVKVTIP